MDRRRRISEEADRGGSTYSSGVDVSLIDSGHDVALSGNVQALGARLVGGGLVAADDVGNDLHLGGLDLHSFPPFHQYKPF